MRRWSLIAALWLLTACTPHGQDATVKAAPSPPAGADLAAGRWVRLPDGRRLSMRCEGQGAPIVLLEGGFAAPASAWEAVQPRLARTTTVCAYDRAGYGASDPGPMPRDGAAVARDLDDAVRARGLSGPFVLVGHSAGALYVRLFYERRAADVIGMVLVDPSIEHQDRSFSVIAGPGAANIAPLRAHALRCLEAARRGDLASGKPAAAGCLPEVRNGRSPPASITGPLLRPSTWLAQISELDTLWTATSDELDSARTPYGAMPLVVLTADGTFAAMTEPLRSKVSERWVELHEALARRSSRGRSELVAGSSHMMILDRPDAVSAAVEGVIAEGRRRR